MIEALSPLAADASRVRRIWCAACIVLIVGGEMFIQSLDPADASPLQKAAMAAMVLIAVGLAYVLAIGLASAVTRSPYVRAIRQEHRREQAPEVESDGIIWVFLNNNYRTGPNMRPECKADRVELRIRLLDGGLAPLWQSGPTVMNPIPYCAKGMHEVSYVQSADYIQARDRARVLLAGVMQR